RIHMNPEAKTMPSDTTLKTDLIKERPNYILSAFGTVKNGPNLIMDQEISPEELRWKWKVAEKEGRLGEYVSIIPPSTAFC
nr:hypothetical protein [Tanacetum cinerariifolium]